MLHVIVKKKNQDIFSLGHTYQLPINNFQSSNVRSLYKLPPLISDLYHLLNQFWFIGGPSAFKVHFVNVSADCLFFMERK